MEYISGSEPVARKEHKCNYCHGVIKIGEKYSKSFLKYDNVYTWKGHISCCHLVDELKMEGDEGITSEDFQESILDKYYELYNIDEFPTKTFHDKLEFVKAIVFNSNSHPNQQDK
jgi:hypothetical protein